MMYEYLSRCTRLDLVPVVGRDACPETRIASFGCTSESERQQQLKLMRRVLGFQDYGEWVSKKKTNGNPGKVY